MSETKQRWQTKSETGAREKQKTEDNRWQITSKRMLDFGYWNDATFFHICFNRSFSDDWVFGKAKRDRTFFFILLCVVRRCNYREWLSIVCRSDFMFVCSCRSKKSVKLVVWLSHGASKSQYRNSATLNHSGSICAGSCRSSFASLSAIEIHFRAMEKCSACVCLCRRICFVHLLVRLLYSRTSLHTASLYHLPFVIDTLFPSSAIVRLDKRKRQKKNQRKKKWSTIEKNEREYQTIPFDFFAFCFGWFSICSFFPHHRFDSLSIVLLYVSFSLHFVPCLLEANKKCAHIGFEQSA